jgi:SAM-dependent methyltransferase
MSLYTRTRRTLKNLQSLGQAWFLGPEWRSSQRQRIFSKIVEGNSWGSAESVSGPGSTLEYTENIRREIPIILRDLKIKSMLDAPCGDYNWARHLQRDGITYIGADIVPGLIKANAKYSDSTTSFRVLDIIEEPLMEVDLWLCRDCLFHLSNSDIHKILANFAKSRIKYLLTTSHWQATANADIKGGDFRLLNLELPPFSFPKPRAAIADFIDGYPSRILGLWHRDNIV